MSKKIDTFLNHFSFVFFISFIVSIFIIDPFSDAIFVEMSSGFPYELLFENLLLTGTLYVFIMIMGLKDLKTKI